MNAELLLAQLSNAPGAVGFEYPVKRLLSDYLQPFPVSKEIDTMGNLVGRFKKFNHQNPTVLIMAHMDEIGFLTAEIMQDGYIKVIPLGGWLNQALWSQKWIIYHNDLVIPAISGIDAPHICSDQEVDTPLTYKKLFLDTGLSKAQLIKQGVRPGLPLVPDVQFSVQANKQRYVGKAFDDRAGLAVMVRLIDKISQQEAILNQVNVAFAATVQEEVGLRGAKVVYESIKPDIVLNLEFGAARDYPCQWATYNDQSIALGKGPTLFIYDRGMLPNTRLLESIYQIAGEHNIPTQWEYEEHYGQDAASLQEKGKGVAAMNIGIPVRYAHSQHGIIDKNDYDNTVMLLYQAIQCINKNYLKRIKTDK